MFVDYSNQNDMRYSSVGIDGTGREDIYKHAIKYIESNLFLANIFDFRNRFGYSPHMLFYNMIIYGGLGGFVCVVVALSIHIKASIIAIFKPLCVENLISFFLQVPCLLLQLIHLLIMLLLFQVTWLFGHCGQYYLLH